MGGQLKLRSNALALLIKMYRGEEAVSLLIKAQGT